MAEHDLRVAPGIAIPDHEIVETASRSRGPGGQNVNKTETRVTLRWDALRSRALAGETRARALRALAGRLTRAGELIVRSDRFRSRERNRAFARERLASLVAAALLRPRPRVKTKPTRSSHERRLEAKRTRAARKQGRGRVRDER